MAQRLSSLPPDSEEAALIRESLNKSYRRLGERSLDGTTSATPVSAPSLPEDPLLSGFAEPYYQRVLRDEEKVRITPQTQDRVDKIFSGSVDWTMIADPGKLTLMDTDTPEVCFLGRSNVGKSSLINAALGTSAAKVSSTPGATQAVHFMQVRGKYRVVDLPGFGYARVGKVEKDRLSELLISYLGINEKKPKLSPSTRRPNLKLICLLIDSRRGIGHADKDLMKQLNFLGTPYLVVLTKADKERELEVTALRKSLEEELFHHGGAIPEIITTSARSHEGVGRLKFFLASAWGLVGVSPRRKPKGVRPLPTPSTKFVPQAAPVENH